MFGKRNDDKITTEPNQPHSLIAPLPMWQKATREYEHGQLQHLENSTDPTTQSVMNEVKVRANDDARHGRRR